MTDPSVLRRLQAALGPDAHSPTDGDLLARFVAGTDPGAFELLVWRHSTTVFRICSTVLRDHHAAEDATQAVFLALARQASSVGQRGTVVGWLCRVANRVANRAARRWTRKELAVDLDQFPAPTREHDMVVEHERLRVLHDELARLPDKFRAPIVLCFLDGLSQVAAAQQLGWPTGTVAGRVAEAKKLLSKRLARRGILLPAVGLAGIVATGSGSALGASFVQLTARAAAAFATGVGTFPGIRHSVLSLASAEVRTVFRTKILWVTGTLIACGAVVFGGMQQSDPPRSGTQAPSVAAHELAVDGGAVAPHKGQAQFSPVEPDVKLKGTKPVLLEGDQEAEIEALKKEIEVLRKKVETLSKKQQLEQRHHKIVVTSPQAKDVVVTQQYVGHIHSQRHINVRAPANGYLEEIPVKEGQAVKKGDVLFRILPVLYKAKLDAELAEVQIAQIAFDNTKRLFKDKVVSQNELALAQAKLAKAQAMAKLAEAELNFTTVRAPFDGLISRFQAQQGSLVKDGDMLTTLSDNSVMWVYFNMPEARYLEYMANQEQMKEGSSIELVLANGHKFPQSGKLGAIEGSFNNETGSIPFRVDFPNPKRLLRHGQVGTVLIHRTLKNVIVIPQRATFEIRNRRYVYVVGKDNVVHLREIVTQNEVDDSFVIKSGLDVNDRIILEGIRQVHDGEKVEYEFRKPEEKTAKPQKPDEK